MNLEIFQKLLARSTETTANVRGFTGRWISGVHRIPDDISSKIDCIVLLLQDRINSGSFCKKDEYLMIYNFQPIHISDSAYLCSLDIVVRPKTKITDLGICEGKPLQLVVDGMNGNIADNSYALTKMGIFVEGEDEAPVCYGNYHDYLELKTPVFSERLTALESRLNSETKVQKEFEHPKPAGIEHSVDMQKALTFAFANLTLCDTPSPASTPSPLLFAMAHNTSGDLGFKPSSVLECRV